MKFISLFAGIGGFDLGLERAGMECVGQVEYNPFCQRVLKHHWPHVKLVGDIHDVTADSFGTADLICGGFPCQPFSSAGRRKGVEDSRFLWPEMLRVIKAYRPTWVLGENVVGIIPMALDAICADLENEGFSCQPIIIPACAVGAPHRRDRVWFVARNASRTRAPKVERVFKGAHSNADRIFSIKGVQEWESQPGMVGMVHGVSDRLDRLRSLGNAVVPQVVEMIGRCIIEAEEAASCGQERPGEHCGSAIYNSQQPQAKTGEGSCGI